MRRPCGLVVSAQLSLRLLKPAPRSANAAMTLRRSRVGRAQLGDDQHVAGLDPTQHRIGELFRAFKSAILGWVLGLPRHEFVVGHAE